MADQVLDPEALTIGFARRFATYKRGTLLLRDRERLKQLIANAQRPIQFIFAGKAHPADQGGKDLIRQIVDFTRDPAVRRRFVFIENYDMSVARMLVQGVDVWLNTPRRPYEASGTSGMKAAANAILNCSVLDGWWVEGYDPNVGWAIGRGEQYHDAEYQDHVESMSLYDILDRLMIPLFYDRGHDNIPREWVRRMKQCLRKLAPVFNTNRMVANYCSQLYMPASRRGAMLTENGFERSARLAREKDALRGAWSGVKVVGVEHSGNGHYKVGQTITVDAIVELNGVVASHLRVQLYSGPMNADGRIESPTAVEMSAMREVAPGRHLFSGELMCQSSGRYGFALRLLPGLTDLATPFEPGMITWG
jgi:starch phosphorylase